MRILPLGGLGEIGKNMTVVEHDGAIVVVDTGLMFPTAEMLGIDLVLPDFSMLRERADDIEAIVLTHGHEDHVGALPYVLREIGMPPLIYRRAADDRHGPLEARGAQAPRRAARGRRDRRDRQVRAVRARDDPHVALDPRRAARSRSRPTSGRSSSPATTSSTRPRSTASPADFSRLAELGSEGLLCLCGDSTNADRPGVAPSESSVGPALLETFSRCEGRIIVTCFASNVHRVQQVIDAAAQLDRKVALVGRSMRKNFNIASNLGMANAPEGMLIQPREIEDYPDEKVIAISTGSQGEPLSALRRMAHGDHRDVELHSGDTVVFSATPGPRQRALRQRDDRPDLRDRRQRDHRRRRPDPRLRPRLAGGA